MIAFKYYLKFDSNDKVAILCNLSYNQVMISADISNASIKDISKKELKKNIREVPNYRLREIGDQWLAAKESCILKVPSIITPLYEYNYIINPVHDDFKKIKDIRCYDFTFDDRLFK